MKKILFTTALFLGLNAFGQVPTHVPTNGLLAYWPFDGDASDVSGNGRDGVANNVTPTTDQNANANSAYNFDYTGYTLNNIDDIITILYDTGINTSELSVSLWFKPTNWSFSGTSGISNIINRMRNFGFSAPEEMWSIIIEDNGTLKVRVRTYTEEVATAPGAIELNNWYHVAFTYDNAELKLYLNGSFVGSIFGQNYMSLSATNDISFGVSNESFGYMNPYNGVIDNAGIWSRALTECEVTELYTDQDCILGVPSLQSSKDKTLVKIVDLMGRETEFKPNTTLIYVYSDGTTEKVFSVE